MKRLNPTTGLPFKIGDIREDNRVFWGYKSKTKITKSTGFYGEDWLTPELYNRKRELGLKRQRRYVTSSKGRAKKLLDGARTRCEKSKLPINITAEWIEKKLNNGACELTGLQFDFKPTNKTAYNAYAPSLDRINSTKGYTKSNVRVVLVSVNLALNQYSDKVMLPILEALVNGLKKNAKENTTTPVPEGSHIQGAVDAELGPVSTPWTWEDDDNTHHHCGTIHWEDVNHRPQESSGDSVGRRGEEMATLIALARLENNGKPDAKTVRLEYRGRYLPNKP